MSILFACWVVKIFELASPDSPVYLNLRQCLNKYAMLLASHIFKKV